MGVPSFTFICLSWLQPSEWGQEQAGEGLKPRALWEESLHTPYLRWLQLKKPALESLSFLSPIRL
jgi:hypothetical protein